MNDLEKFKEEAQQLDAADPLKGFKKKFVTHSDRGRIYLCNNSLGLPSYAGLEALQKRTQQWADLGVEGWFRGEECWYTSLEKDLKSSLAHLLGTDDEEVVVMNSLTVNLHLLLVSFYRPTASRYKILIEEPSFPSDLYPIKSHLRYHGLDPDEALLVVRPSEGEHLLRQEEVEKILAKEGEKIALVFLSHVNFLTGQVLDIERIAEISRKQGCLVSCDLAHAAGNIPLHLHEWGVDFAVGCSYKYLCSGPGGPGIAYVHTKHHREVMPRFSGWWGNDPETRFKMHLQPEFIPHGGASSWQVSTPSILSMTPLVPTLKIFEEAGVERMREKSVLQTRFLLKMLEDLSSSSFTVVTPKEEDQRGCQISLMIHEDCEGCLRKLEERGIICDFRPPNIIRVTPSPLYNTFEDIFNFVRVFMN